MDYMELELNNQKSQNEYDRIRYELFFMSKAKHGVDGNQFYVLYGESIQDGICGFGDTLYDAICDFYNDFHRKLPKRHNVDDIMNVGSLISKDIQNGIDKLSVKKDGSK